MFASPRVRARKFLAILLLASLPFAASAQEDKKTDDDKPADPDTGESTVEEKTLGILPNPLLNTA
jgi:porin